MGPGTESAGSHTLAAASREVSDKESDPGESLKFTPLPILSAKAIKLKVEEILEASLGFLATAVQPLLKHHVAGSHPAQH